MAKTQAFPCWRAGVAVLAVALSAPVWAQSDWPTQTIRLIVPFTPGSTSDISARAVAAAIAKPLGQPVVIENRPGANGAIGMDFVAKSRPDGYTLVVSSVSSTVVPSVVLKKPSFDLLKDFAPVSVIAGTSLLMSVPKESPIQSVADLVAAAKKAPGTMTYGNSAGLYQLAMEALNQQAGIDLAAVNYKGPAEAMTDLLGGRLTLMPDSLGSATKMINAGRTKPLAILSGKRAALLPNVPTMAELGYKDFDFLGWIGILAPAGTPEPVLRRLHDEIAKAVASPEIRAVYATMAIDPLTVGPADYSAMLAREMARYARIAAEARIEKQ